MFFLQLNNQSVVSFDVNLLLTYRQVVVLYKVFRLKVIGYVSVIIM